MQHIKIISDSTCDLPAKLIEQYSIGITPLYVCKGGKEFRDGVDIVTADIFAHVDAGGELCTTSAVSVHDYESVYRRFAPHCDAVIQITIGSGFSSCYQNATIAAAEFSNVYVVDSENLSVGQGLLVLAAARWAEEGLTAEEIVAQLRELAPRVETSFLIDRLDYMAKGGRCSMVTALGANLLHLKPCLEVRGGKLVVVKKYRGTFERCMRRYVQERLTGREDIDTSRAIIAHGAAYQESVDATWEETRACGVFEELIPSRLGCTVSCHCGPCTMGVVFLRK